MDHEVTLTPAPGKDYPPFTDAEGYTTTTLLADKVTVNTIWHDDPDTAKLLWGGPDLTEYPYVSPKPFESRNASEEANTWVRNTYCRQRVKDAIKVCDDLARKYQEACDLAISIAHEVEDISSLVWKLAGVGALIFGIGSIVVKPLAIYAEKAGEITGGAFAVERFAAEVKSEVTKVSKDFLQPVKDAKKHMADNGVLPPVNQYPEQMLKEQLAAVLRNIVRLQHDRDILKNNPLSENDHEELDQERGELAGERKELADERKELAEERKDLAHEEKAHPRKGKEDDHKWPVDPDEPPSSPEPPPSGNDITWVQNALKKLGYDPGRSDGLMGPHTKAAVNAFQKDHGLQADGIVGPKTRAALQKALAGAQPQPPSPPQPSRAQDPGDYVEGDGNLEEPSPDPVVGETSDVTG